MGLFKLDVNHVINKSYYEGEEFYMVAKKRLETLFNIHGIFASTNLFYKNSLFSDTVYTNFIKVRSAFKFKFMKERKFIWNNNCEGLLRKIQFT